MFTHAILPTLRSHYYDPTKPGMGWEAYEQKCKAFAEKIKLPNKDAHRVTLPCFISIDWDTRHTWVRQYIAMPGRSADALAAFDDQTFIIHGLPNNTATPASAPPPAAFNLFDALEPAERLLQLSHVSRLQQAENIVSERTRYRDEFFARTACDMILAARWKPSLSNNNFITVLAQQFMPLSKISPDIHSPAEHMVGTIKNTVKALLLACDFGDVELWKGRTYQRFINEAVATRGNGNAGQHHIGKSVQKQEIICKILATDEGKAFPVHYVFGKPGEKKRKVHTVHGTAGGWIKATGWT